MEISYHLDIRGDIKPGVHFNSHVQLFYVMSGSAELRLDGTVHPLYKDELCLVNFGANYQLSHIQDCVLAILRFDYSSLLQAAGRSHCHFQCDTYADVYRSHYNLKKQFNELLRTHLIGGRPFQESSAFYAVLNCLLDEYSDREDLSQGEKADLRMADILLYVHLHYREPLDLNSVCEKFFFAPSTFTRLFRKSTSMSFLQYLNMLRLQHAREDLEYTAKPVTQIALDNGFSSLSAFNKTFKKAYGISPTACRTAESDSQPQQLSSEELQAIREDYIRTSEQRLPTSQQMIRKQAALDCRKHHPYRKVWNQAIGVGRASELLSARLQKQICSLRDEVGCRYVRLPHFFSQDMLLRGADDPSFISYEHVDSVLDFVLENKLIPFIVIGGHTLPRSLHDQPAHAQKDSLCVFRDMADFRFVVENVLQHIMVRYNVERLADWVWEVQFDSARHTEEEYFEQFRIVTLLLRRWNPRAHIGGCGHILGDSADPLLAKWKTQEAQPDFFSVSAYPYEKDSCSRKTVRSMDPAFFSHQIRSLKDSLREAGYAELPLCLTEWNTSRDSRNYTNDSCAKGTQMLKIMVDLLDTVDLGIYDFASDLNVSRHGNNHLLFGGQGLLSRDGLPKPSYFSIANWKYAGEELIMHGDNFLFTLRGNNLLLGLCYNDKPFNLNYYRKDEADISPEDLEIIYANTDDLEQQFHISGLQNGLYCIKQGIFNEQNSLLTRWIKIGSESALEIGDLEYLRQTVHCDISIRQEKVSNETLTFSLNLPAHEFRLITIYPLKLED